MNKGDTHSDDKTGGHEDDKKKLSEPVMLSSLRPRKSSQSFPKPREEPEAPSKEEPKEESELEDKFLKGSAPELDSPETIASGAADDSGEGNSEEDEDDTDQDDTGEEGDTEGEVPSEPPEPEILDTVPVSKEGVMEKVPEHGQLLEACSACGTLIDVTNEAPFSKIHCPSCGQALRARKQFNHFRIVELIGQGGMGDVFRAEDCNLNRMVALKVLKKELATSAEEREKLAQESRTTASIHHPHVVKVFSFGEDHGQFYMAMELVKQNSLDELLSLQRRVPEAQVLQVGIQIAEGLQAAFEKGLLHRDIKPGNILFADAHNAKLVDFGLAIVADQAAAAVGEIWGTPYYIAPEKLDNQPEDIRSDIYSLGGTLFHALAGRPPYEADTASMVALKQLKSQPVSLQSFAPDVTSETSYVINRMLAKNADERYDSYEELIEHLHYSHAKLMERTNRPPQPKARVVLENKQTQTFRALISLVLLGVVLAGGLAVYVFRDSIFPAVQASRAGGFVESDFYASLEEGIALANAQRFDEATALFTALAKTPGIPQPEKNWALMNQGLATLLVGNGPEAAAIFQGIHDAGLYSEAKDQLALANFFSEAARLLSNPDEPITSGTARLYSSFNAEAFGLLLFALHDWQLGDFSNAYPLFAKFLAGRVPRDAPWIGDYKSLAKIYAEDAKIIRAIENQATADLDAAAVEALRQKINDARLEIRTGDRASERLDQIAESLQ